jgi:hypothetical protein
MAEKRKLRIGPLTTVGQVAGELGRLYRQATQSAKDDEESVALPALSRIESRIAATPAEGLRGLVVKLGLDRFLRTPSEQADSAYADLVRLTGHDPATEILANLRRSNRH